jgi:predicted ferric reductase
MENPQIQNEENKENEINIELSHAKISKPSDRKIISNEDYAQISQTKIKKWNSEGKWKPYEHIRNESAFFNFLPDACFKIRNIISRPFTFYPIKCLQLSWGEIILLLLMTFGISGVAAITILSDKKSGDEATGSLASVLMALAFASSGKNLAFHLILGMPWERQVMFHKFIAFFALGTSIAHGLLMGMGHDESLSGWILTGGIGGMIVTSFLYLRRYCYRIFYILHLLIIPMIIVFAVIHEAGGIIVGVGIWAADLAIRTFLIARFKYKISKTEIFALPGDIVRVEITPKDGKRFMYRGGQYVFICIPKANLWEWHPISISSCSFDEKIVLHFKKTGRWTKNVYNLIQKKGQEISSESGFNNVEEAQLSKVSSVVLDKNIKKLETLVLINGPYGAPRVDIDSPRYKLVLLVCGGIGVTPMQSILNESIIQYLRGRPFIKIKFIWSLRSEDVVDSVAGHEDNVYDKKDLDERLIRDSNADNIISYNLSDVVDTEIYLTRNGSEKIKNRLEKRYRTNVFLKRPNFDTIFDEMKDVALKNGEKDIAVLTCGPSRLVSNVFSKCYSLTKKYDHENKKMKVNFDFHTEVFEF